MDMRELQILSTDAGHLIVLTEDLKGDDNLCSAKIANSILQIEVVAERKDIYKVFIDVYNEAVELKLNHLLKNTGVALSHGK